MEAESLWWLAVLVVVIVLPFVIGAIWVEKVLEKLYGKPGKCSKANENGQSSTEPDDTSKVSNE